MKSKLILALLFLIIMILSALIFSRFFATPTYLPAPKPATHSQVTPTTILDVEAIVEQHITDAGEVASVEEEDDDDGEDGYFGAQVQVIYTITINPEGGMDLTATSAGDPNWVLGTEHINLEATQDL